MVDTTDFIRDYDPNTNPTIINSFTAGAFRTCHNQIFGLIRFVATINIIIILCKNSCLI